MGMQDKAAIGTAAPDCLERTSNRDAEAVRPYFRQLRELRDAYAQRHLKLQLNALSMGMTHDYAVAIEEGATEIRLGTALFGARVYSNA